ncbi:hypothetical protein LCGC14_2591420 [marine sediment metagenome]|uniref:Uncharacterized protein n=1 Tax=marine sediment metagenome TaxID=412755 RepID=A0A0F9D4A0_9ZZZZ
MSRPGGFKYKNDKVLHSAYEVPWHPILVDVNLWILGRYGILIVTSAYRPHKIHPGDSGIHSTVPLRADDIRSYIYPTPDELMERDINENWQYDPKRTHLKVAVFHDTGQGIHGHIQVHPNTVRIL